MQDQRPSQPALVRQSGVISADEFGTLFRQSHRTLWLIAVGVVHDRTLADDVIQEAALVALGKLAEFETGSNFVAWMASIVRFVALNKGRRERRRRATPLDAALEQVSPTPAAEVGELAQRARGQLPADQQLFDDAVVAALADVSEVARACLLLRTIDGMDYCEIAAALDIPAGTAMSHVHRTRTLLRERLTGRRAPASGDAA